MTTHQKELCRLMYVAETKREYNKYVDEYNQIQRNVECKDLIKEGLSCLCRVKLSEII